MICSVDGCEKRAKTRGWCSAHYERWRRNGDPGPAGDARRMKPKPPPCTVEGCERLRASLRTGYCAKHHACYQATGDPIARKRPNYGVGRRKVRAGYIHLWKPGHPLARKDGYVAEHRYVAWEAGALTDPSMVVHHIDHDKSNNHISNLQVMQPSDHLSKHVTEDGVTNQFGHFSRQKPECSVPSCGNSSCHASLCPGHHTRLQRWGTVAEHIPLGDLAAARRFAAERATGA